MDKTFRDRVALLMLEKLLTQEAGVQGIMIATTTRDQRERIAYRCYAMAESMENVRNGHGR